MNFFCQWLTVCGHSVCCRLLRSHVLLYRFPDEFSEHVRRPRSKSKFRHRERVRTLQTQGGGLRHVPDGSSHHCSDDLCFRRFLDRDAGAGRGNADQVNGPSAAVVRDRKRRHGDRSHIYFNLFLDTNNAGECACYVISVLFLTAPWPNPAVVILFGVPFLRPALGGRGAPLTNGM